jgi:hypothetical protein
MHEAVLNKACIWVEVQLIDAQMIFNVGE